MPGFMWITGKSQGPIEGSVDLKDTKGSIELYSYDHKVAIPRSPDTGLYKGRRLHHEITVCKETDKSTPKLYQALCTGEVLTDVIMSWYRFMDVKGPVKLYTVMIENSIITCIKPWIPNRMDPSYEGYYHMENVSFSYEKITWTWEPDGIKFIDSWTP